MNQRKLLTVQRGTRPRSGHRPSRAAAFTLVEVMMAMMVLGTAAFAALATLLFSYRTSTSDLRAQAAFANARTIAEQLQTLDQGSLSAATVPVDLPSSPIGSLVVDEWNPRTDDIHGTAGSTADDLEMSFRIEIAQPDPATNFSCAQVIVRYRWNDRTLFVSRTREDALTVVVSDVAAD